MKILFYLEEDKLSPRGGPYGVGYYYWNEMKRRNEKPIDFINDSSTKKEIMDKGRKIVAHFPKFLYKLQHEFRDIRWLKNIFSEPLPTKKVDLDAYDIIQFHETLDMYLEKKQLENYNGIVILQSHSPLPLGVEKSLDCPKLYKTCIPDIAEKFNEVDRYAFERADYLIFPCEEAEEPYIENWDIYSDIKSRKKGKYKYVLTGINQAIALRNRLEVRNELGIPDNEFIVCYAGRHNLVKGYDSLIKIGTKFIGEGVDNWVVVAGRLGSIEPPTNSRWKEIGWTTDAYSYINAADVFILPNKVTYFDLVMIEVLSLGKIVIASRTGGNKFFESNHVPGVFLYDTEEEALRLLEKVKSMTEKERNELGDANIAFYKERLSVEAMYDGYMRMISEIEEERKMKGNKQL